LPLSSLVYTWVFVRGDDQIRIMRPTPLQLVVSRAPADARTHDFDTPLALLEFQLEFEAQLMRSGWYLEAFSPERRSGHDRRQIPRATGSDRRRKH
jgi:hypothetical protein